VVQNSSNKRLILESVLFILLQNSTQTISKYLPILLSQNLSLLSSIANNNNNNNNNETDKVLISELGVLADVLK